MQYRYMGKTGLKVSELCLGAMTFGRETNEADSFAILDRFVAAGGSAPSTAHASVSGHSKKDVSITKNGCIIGSWITLSSVIF